MKKMKIIDLLKRIAKSKCKHKEIEEFREMFDEQGLIECDLYCKTCGAYLGHWAYGHYFDISKEGKKAHIEQHLT